MFLPALLLLASSLFPALVRTETVWAAVTVNNYGDRIPLLSPEYSVLTALGANQMYQAGQFFNDRYISPSNVTINGNHTIAGISPDAIDNWQTYTLSLYEIFIDQSTQAFKAGMYPPLKTISDITNLPTPYSQPLADGNVTYWPNSGAQYPQIMFATENDYKSIYLQGMAYCPNLQTSISNFETTASYQDVASNTNSFYQSLANDVLGAVSGYNLAYSSAYDLWDYISYQSLHNSSAKISEDTVAQARYLADSYVYSVYGNITADNNIRVVGGRTLANITLDSLIHSKLTNIFTSFEPIVSLFALMGLDGLSDNFRAMPNLGSSLVFELFTNDSIPLSDPTQMPDDVNDLSVRFLFRNGTTATTNISQTGLGIYPIFGHDDTQGSMSFEDFANAMEGIMISDPGIWCEACGAESNFCANFTNAAANHDPSNDSSTHQVTPVVAGVIGALVALVVAAILLLLAMLLLGIRFRRERKQRRSELGGFKGSEKLASDPDLPSKNAATRAKDGTVIGASVIPGSSDASGHRRVESWELKEGGGVDRRPSFEADADASMKGVEAIERV